MYSVTTLATLTLVVVAMVTQTRQQQVLQYHVAEGQPIDTFVADVKKDIHLLSNYTPPPEEPPILHPLARLRFAFKYESKLFHVDNVTGIIRTRRVLDREALCPGSTICDQTVVVVLRPVQFYALVKVTITVDDVNDHAPTFPNASVTIEVSSVTPRGSLFQIPSADDEDQGLLGISKYHLVQDYGMFELQVTYLVDGSQDVRVRLIGQLDRRRSYNLTMVATDGGVPPRSGQMNVMIVIKNVLESRVMFERDIYEVDVFENAPVLSPVIRVRLRDQPAVSDQVVYGLLNDTITSPGETTEEESRLLAINAITGQIYINGQIDFEKYQTLRLTLTASLVTRQRAPQIALARLIVNVLDINDNAPNLQLNTFTTSGRAAVIENAHAGTFVAHVTVTDPDQEDNSRSLCHLNNPSLFVLKNIAAFEYKISTAVSFDREQWSSHVVTLACHDSGTPSLTSSVDLVIEVLDVNDNRPRFARDIYVIGIEENKGVNEKVTTINASDEDDTGKNSQLIYHLIPLDYRTSVLSVNPQTGEIYSNVVLDHERQPQYSFQLTVSDRGDPPLSSDTSLILNVGDLNDNAPRFLTSFYIFNVTRRSLIGTVLGTVSAVDDDLSPVHRILSYTLEDTNPFVTVDYDSGEVTTTNNFTTIGQFQFIVRAANTLSNLPLYDLVNVAVIVINQLPVFIFPSSSNHTVEIRADARSGQMLTCLEVLYDEQLHLRYSIVYGTPRVDQFTLDRLTGCIYMKGDFNIKVVYMLRISVGDFNEPRDQVLADIWFVPANTSSVDSSSALGTLSLVSSSDQLFIMVCIGCGMAGLFSLVVILAIAILRYHRKRSRCYGDYNCREEAFRSQTDGLSEVIYGDHVSGSNSSTVEGDVTPCNDIPLVDDVSREMGGGLQCRTQRVMPVRKEVTFCLDYTSFDNKHLAWMPPDILHPHIAFQVNCISISQSITIYNFSSLNHKNSAFNSIINTFSAFYIYWFI